MTNPVNCQQALDERETAEDLSACEYKVRVDGKIALEPKEQVKERLGRSPGCGDAFVLTFAFPVGKKPHQLLGQQQGKTITEYDPYAWLQAVKVTILVI